MSFGLAHPADCCFGEVCNHCHYHSRTSSSSAFCASESRWASCDPCIEAVFFSGAACAHYCRLTMNLMTTTTANLAALKTRHSVSYCGRFSGILHLRPWFLGPRRAFFVAKQAVCASNCRWINFINWFRCCRHGDKKIYGNFHPANARIFFILSLREHRLSTENDIEKCDGRWCCASRKRIQHEMLSN